MIVACPACGTHYRRPSDLDVPDARARCGRCRTEFRPAPEGRRPYRVLSVQAAAGAVLVGGSSGAMLGGLDDPSLAAKVQGTPGHGSGKAWTYRVEATAPAPAKAEAAAAPEHARASAAEEALRRLTRRRPVGGWVGSVAGAVAAATAVHLWGLDWPVALAGGLVGAMVGWRAVTWGISS